MFSLGECKSLILSIRGHQATVEQQVKFIIWKITAGLKKYIIVCMQKKKKKSGCGTVFPPRDENLRF